MTMNEKILDHIMQQKQSLESKHIIRKHWRKTAVFTDSRPLSEKGMSADCKVVPDNHLLPGELSATVFQVGCYTVRSAERVYREQSDIPADDTELELFKNCRNNSHALAGQPSVRDLSCVREISARHIESTSGEFVPVCNAGQSKSFRFVEGIGDIFTAKENMTLADKDASLFICVTYAGMDYSEDTWYKLDPLGKIEVLRLHPYNENLDDAKFEPLESKEGESV